MLFRFGFGSWTLRLLLTRRRSLCLALRRRLLLLARRCLLFTLRRLLLARSNLLLPLRGLWLLARGGLLFARRRAGFRLRARGSVGLRGTGSRWLLLRLRLTGGVAFGSRGGAIWLRWLRGRRSGLGRTNLIRTCSVGRRIGRIGAGGVRLRCIRLRLAGANLVRRCA